MFEYLEDNWMWLVIFGFLCFFVFIAVTIEKTNTIFRNEISAQGFNIKDVEIFLKGTDYTTGDFLASPSLRKQYQLFQEGNNDFMDKARLAKKANDAKSSASMAVGISAASMATSSSR